MVRRMAFSKLKKAARSYKCTVVVRNPPNSMTVTPQNCNVPLLTQSKDQLCHFEVVAAFSIGGCASSVLATAIEHLNTHWAFRG